MLLTLYILILLATGADTMHLATPKATMNTSKVAPTHNILPKVAFSHLQLYVDRVEDLSVYKNLEKSLNSYHLQVSESANGPVKTTAELKELWGSISPTDSPKNDQVFIPQNRDVVKQMITGFGYRVTGCRYPSAETAANTQSLLLTSRDPGGVQVIVTAIAEDASSASDDYLHFDEENLRRFFSFHANRQGIAILGFQVKGIDTIYERYQRLHPNLVHSYQDYCKDGTKVLEVYAYYSHENPNVPVPENRADVGTIIRFVESSEEDVGGVCVLPGLIPVDATFDGQGQPAYCDHWVSNVFSRTEFLGVLEDTLGFTPKVDFNAGVVAAGEAQIESTVTGNDSSFVTSNKKDALRDQSQVYLPINNALSSVGHVHGFLEEIGQGVQHVASRVENLVEFVQRCNDIRAVTGEGFTFLNIPRSYYGVLSKEYLIETCDISETLALDIMAACEKSDVISLDGAVDLSATKDSLGEILDGVLGEGYQDKRDDVLDSILRSRYKNLFSLLHNHICDETYMGIVKNQILVDVQGEDILYQIFTCNILQREPGEEAPFFEFIQRVCSECKDEDGCPAELKPGCGGFGIRNFLTLFLSIEVSKAMLEVSEAALTGDERRRISAQKRVDCFTSQLNDSNPILTQISDAMTEEGQCQQQLETAEAKGDTKQIEEWRKRMLVAKAQKEAGNAKLMECSSLYDRRMRELREATRVE